MRPEPTGRRRVGARAGREPRRLTQRTNRRMVRWYRGPESDASIHSEASQLRIAEDDLDRRASSGYLPALDGLRGLAVILVFCFHAGLGWARGGFLGVSIFFTLSGFLITRLLLDEGVRDKAIDLGRFWTRRVRRLLPAALVTVLFVLVLGASVLGTSSSTLRADAFAALGYVANWRFLYAGNSYADLFSAPTPFLHFWSLAIEEQFYLLYPLAALVLVRRSRAGRALRRTWAKVLAVGIAISLGLTLVAATRGDFDFVYYSLPTRAGELLVGGLLACSTIPARLVGIRARPALRFVGWFAITAIFVVCATTSQTSTWLYYGGMTGFAILSATVIACSLPLGGIAAPLTTRPMRALGKISYGVYLYHWPIILWLTEDRVGVRGAPLILAQAAVTVAVASVSYLAIEQPVRRGQWPRGRRAWIIAPSAVALVVLVALVVGTIAPRATATDFAEAQRVAAAAATRTPAPPEAGSQPAAAQPERVAFFGDSTALLTSLGVARWTATGAGLQFVGNDTGLGCGVVRGGLVRYQGGVSTARDGCPDWAQSWPELIAQAQPQVAVVQFGPFDVSDHLLEGDTQWRAPGDAVYDRYLENEMLLAVDLFLDRGITPIWLTSPMIDVDRPRQPRPPEPDPANDPARMVRFNQLIRAVQAQRPALRIIDLAAWLRSRPGGELDPSFRPDGIHFTDASTAIVAAWLAPRILRAARGEPRFSVR